MKVTLSYFIEPSPGRRGWNNNHRYQSFGLRFDTKRPTESFLQFKQRINRATWEDPDQRPAPMAEERDWDLKENLRTRGSIHSDKWTGTAAQLAASGAIAVYPVVGWWRERPHLEGWRKAARYSLMVTIESPREDIDLYTPIVNAIAAEQEIEIDT